jgi:hypothetical protein
MRIVALVDSMLRRGPADLLIEPLRDRLARLRPPRPLRFDRLLFHPLDLLIVTTHRWLPEQQAIPRAALMPMADHVRLAMGPAGTAIVAEIDGRTTDDGALISRLGATLWPAAAAILARQGHWEIKGLRESAFRLLAEVADLDTLRAEASTGLLPVGPGVVEAILTRVARTNQTALPMMIALLLDNLPEAAERLAAARGGAMVAETPLDAAIDLLLQQLDRDEGTERRIAAGTLAEAGAAASRLAALLGHLDTVAPKLRRRELLRTVRQRLDLGCRERFASGLRDEMLDVLERPGGDSIDEARIEALEATARGLRLLEAAGRSAGGGPGYDVLLRKVTATIKDSAMRDRLTLCSRARLVEILSGSDAALAMLDAPG